MKHKMKSKRGGKQKKREWMMGVGLIAYLIGLIIRIPLGRIIGDKGIGFFSAGMEIFAVISVILSYSISKSVAILIKYRIKREMYKSARRVFKNALFVAIIFSALAAAGVFFFSEYIADTIVLEHMSYLSIAAMAPAVFLASVMGVLKGYFQGMGTMIPTVHSKLLEKFIMFAASLILGSVLYTYGLKVADLLKNREYASAYGGLGAAFGLTVACAIGLLHLWFIYMVYSGTFKQQLMKDSSKYVESNGQIVSMLITTALPYALCALFYNMNYLADQRIFNYAMNMKGQSSIRLLHWGVYYGKYSVVIGIAGILCALAGIYSIPKIAQAFDRQEYQDAKAKLGRTVHFMAIVSIPCAVIIAVLAEPIVGILFKGELKTAIKLVQAGTAVIVLFAFTYFFAGFLQRIRKIKIVILGGLIGFTVHLICLIALINNTDLGITAVVYSSIIFYLITSAAGFLGIMKYMQYSQEWIRTFAVTLIAAGITGLIGMLLNKAIFSFAGNILTLVVIVPVCLIIYNVLLIVLKGVRAEELELMPGGRIIVSVAERLHLM